MKVYTGDTFAQIYNNVLCDVIYSPEYVTSPRGLKINELTNVALVLKNPRFCLYDNERRSSQYKYIGAELVWYFSGRNDINFISPFAKFWETLDNGDGTVNSAYGNLIFTEKNEYGLSQYEWALQSLIKDKDSRQAILHFNKPHHQRFDNKDFVCTLTGIFQIRNNCLNFTVDMRSNDLILGTPTDVAFFCVLQEQLYYHLKQYYPKLKLGTYTHIVHSLHVYERHFNLIKEMLNHSFEEMSIPEIKESLINEDGTPTEDLKIFEYRVEEGINKQPEINDTFYNWLFNIIHFDLIYNKNIFY